MTAYIIFQHNPDGNLAEGRPLYLKRGVYNARTAVEALTRFAADNGIEIGDGPASGKHWIHGRKSLQSFGKGQYKADVTTLPANLEAAI